MSTSISRWSSPTSPPSTPLSRQCGANGSERTALAAGAIERRPGPAADSRRRSPSGDAEQARDLDGRLQEPAGPVQPRLYPDMLKLKSEIDETDQEIRAATNVVKDRSRPSTSRRRARKPPSPSVGPDQGRCTLAPGAQHRVHDPAAGGRHQPDPLRRPAAALQGGRRRRRSRDEQHLHRRPGRAADGHPILPSLPTNLGMGLFSGCSSAQHPRLRPRKSSTTPSSTPETSRRGCGCRCWGSRRCSARAERRTSCRKCIRQLGSVPVAAHGPAILDRERGAAKTSW